MLIRGFRPMSLSRQTDASCAGFQLKEDASTSLCWNPSELAEVLSPDCTLTVGQTAEATSTSATINIAGATTFRPICLQIFRAKYLDT